MMSLCQMNIEGFSIQDVSIIYIKIRLSSPLDFRGALHWTFEALSTGLLILGVLIRICVSNALKTQKYSLRSQKKVKNKIGKKLTHWTFQALSTGLSRRSPLDFWGSPH